MTSIAIWARAARPKTLIAALSPVCIGLVLSSHNFQFKIALLTLLTALGIQIGTNFANDLFDFLKGADTSLRKGPLRVTQAGLVSVSAIKKATLFVFILTALLGSYLVWIGGLPIAALLALSLLFGIIYTGGPYPLGYLGLGDLFVLIFFGPVATASTYYLQTHTFSLQALLAGIAPGLLSTALLAINNVRDEQEDRLCQKKTLIVRFGNTFGKIEYTLLLLLAPLPLFFYENTKLPLLLYLPALPLIWKIWKIIDPQDFNPLLAKTGMLLWIYTLFFFLSYG